MLLVFLVAALIATSYLLEDKIVNKSVAVINKQLNVPVKVNSIDFSLLKQFPNASLQLNNVLLLSDKTFKANDFNQSYADTLLYFKELYLSVNLLSLINNKLDITKAYCKQGQVNFLVDQLGKENFKVLKQKPIKESSDSSKNELAFMLDQIQLKEVKIRILNKYKNTGLVLFAPNYTVKGNFYKKNYTASAKGKLLLHSFNQGKLKLSPSTPASVLLNLAISNNSIQIDNGYIQTKAYKFGTSGVVKLSSPIYLDLKLTGNSNKLGQLIKDLNIHANNQFESSGNIGVSAVIKGFISNVESPSIAANFKIENGTYSHKQIYNFSNINVSGSFSNGSERSSESSRIEILNFRCASGKSKVEGTALLVNFNKPLLKTEINPSLYLNDLESMINIKNINYTGECKGKVRVSGLVNLEQDWKFNLKHLNKEGHFIIKDAGVFVNNPDFALSDFNAGVKFDDAWFTFENISAKVQSSNIKGSASIMGYANAVTDSTYPIKIKSNLMADDIRYSDFESFFEGSGNTNSRLYEIVCECTSQRAEYKNIEFTNVKGKLLYKDDSFTVPNIAFNTQGGEVQGSLKYYPVSRDKYLFQTHSKTKNVNIKSVFKAFNNFNQTYIKSENLNGNLTSDFELEMLFNKSDVDTASIELLGHVRIDDGELIGFKPISEAGRFSDIDELKHIEFSKLENDILITNSTIHIPRMEITSNAFDMEINGHQKFSGDYKYHLKINMSDFLGGKSKRLSKQQSEFGYIEDDGFGKKTLFLVATSTNDVSQVKLDRAAIKDNFKHKRKQEKQEFKQLLRNEFGLFKNDSTLINNSKQDDKKEFIIEWDEE